MRVVYRSFGGRRVVREFSDWWSLCVWVKRYYPLVTALAEVGAWVERH